MNCPQTQPKCDVQPAPKPGPKGGGPPPKTGFESFNFVQTKQGNLTGNLTKGRKVIRPRPSTEFENLERTPKLKGQLAAPKKKTFYFRSN